MLPKFLKLIQFSHKIFIIESGGQTVTMLSNSVNRMDCIACSLLIMVFRNSICRLRAQNQLINNSSVLDVAQFPWVPWRPAVNIDVNWLIDVMVFASYSDTSDDINSHVNNWMLSDSGSARCLCLLAKFVPTKNQFRVNASYICPGKLNSLLRHEYVNASGRNQHPCIHVRKQLLKTTYNRQPATNFKSFSWSAPVRSTTHRSTANTLSSTQSVYSFQLVSCLHRTKFSSQPNASCRQAGSLVGWQEMFCSSEQTRCNATRHLDTLSSLKTKSSAPNQTDTNRRYVSRQPGAWKVEKSAGKRIEVAVLVGSGFVVGDVRIRSTVLLGLQSIVAVAAFYVLHWWYRPSLDLVQEM